MDSFGFTEEQVSRYSRHIILPKVGGKGQRKLLDSKVLVIGTGGLGSPCAYYLAAAGVGALGIVDDDQVELSNLQRQILHFTQDIGRDKTDSAEEKLANLNRDVRVVKHNMRVESRNILGLIGGYDAVIDCTDNFPSRFLINDACVFAKKTLIHAGVFRFEGQAMTIIPGEGPCYRCLFPEPPPPGVVPNCQEAGIFGCVAGILGTVQAIETIKVLLGLGDILNGKLFIFDSLEMTSRLVRIPHNKDCAVCGQNATIQELIDYEQPCETSTAGNP